MDFEITEEKILEVAKRYGLKAQKSNNPGFYINDVRKSSDELFEHLFKESLFEEVETVEMLGDVKAKKGQTEFTFKDIDSYFEYERYGVA